MVPVSTSLLSDRFIRQAIAISAAVALVIAMGAGITAAQTSPAAAPAATTANPATAPVPATAASAAAATTPPPATAAAAAPPSGDSIPPGTTITMANWQQYQQFMPDGMAAMFQGKYFWKMPADVKMDVGPTVIHPLPKGYMEATEKYSGQTN